MSNVIISGGRDLDVDVLVQQIGRWNLMGISGGRVRVDGERVVLPVGSGYRVEIELAPNDTYTVRRVFVRGTKRFVKGELTDVYFDQVGEVAYQASSFRSYDFPKGE